MEIKTANKALALVKRYPYVHVLWHKENCPACSHFVPELEAAEDQMSDWVFVKVDADEHKRITDQMSWEPTSFPISYLFVNGERKFVAIGAAPIEDVITAHQELVEGTWKSPEQLEQEQLDALDEQE